MALAIIGYDWDISVYETLSIMRPGEVMQKRGKVIRVIAL